jgi:hypothetical protein
VFLLEVSELRDDLLFQAGLGPPIFSDATLLLLSIGRGAGPGLDREVDAIRAIVNNKPNLELGVRGRLRCEPYEQRLQKHPALDDKLQISFLYEHTVRFRGWKLRPSTLLRRRSSCFCGGAMAQSCLVLVSASRTVMLGLQWENGVTGLETGGSVDAEMRVLI